METLALNGHVREMIGNFPNMICINGYQYREGGGIVQIQILLRTTKNRKLWTAMISDVLEKILQSTTEPTGRVSQIPRFRH